MNTRKYWRKDNKINHKGTKKLETERLILRPFKNTDGKDMFKNWSNDDR